LRSHVEQIHRDQLALSEAFLRARGCLHWEKRG
jgi:hypothetical protein